MGGLSRRAAVKGLGAATAMLAGAVRRVGAQAGGGVVVAVDQAGYLPGARKVASVAGGVAGARFFVERVESGAVGPTSEKADVGHTNSGGGPGHSVSAGQVFLDGVLGAAVRDAASGDAVAAADFSAMRAPGVYRLRVEGGGASAPFTVGDGVYRPALRLAMRAFYGQRCGCVVDLGEGWRHASCHAMGDYHPSSGRAGKLPGNPGGWHDAGDYGRYVVNSGITTGTLLWAWEMFPEALRGLRLDIPESGGRIPDFLAEVRWNLDWMLAMQDPADGGVWHKQTSAVFCGMVMPEADPFTSEVIGTGAAPWKSVCATADFAAVMAIASRCYRAFDAAFADLCLRAARAAYGWAAAHPASLFLKNPPGVSTGAYEDTSSADELLWAAAELYRTTGEAEFAMAFAAGVPATFAVNTPGWNDVRSMALWTYALGGQADAALKARIVAATAHAAEERMARVAGSGYGCSLQMTEFVWGSNGLAANDGLLLLLADRLAGVAGAREAALANLHYLLGRNCFGVSWVTGVGSRPFQQPHHRPSVADGVAAPWPGLLSGGPNAHGGDPVADALRGRAPMRMWVDDARAYSLNEVAINWNAPLVFLLAGVCG